MPGIMAALTTALPYITAAWQVGSSYLTKPKKEDYVPTGSMYNRYINYLKSKTAESTVYHQRMRPALRQIGAQTQRGQRQVGYQVARDKPGGGIEAQMRMGINRQALEAIGIASEKASIAQEQVNIKTGEQLMRIGVQEEFALQRYTRAKQLWTKQMFAATTKAGINLSNTLVKKHIADTKLKLEAAKDAKEEAEIFNTALEKMKADKLIPQDTTPEKLRGVMDIEGYKDPDMMHRYLANVKKIKEADYKFQKDLDIEKIEKDSFETLRQFTEKLEKMKDPTQAYAEFDKVKDGMIIKDKNKALTKVESTFPDLVYDDPLERKIAVAESANNRTAAKKNLAEAVETGTVEQIEKADSAINTIDSRTRANINFQYSQETRQTAKDKKEYDAKALESTLNNNVASTIAYLGIYDRTYPAIMPEPSKEYTVTEYLEKKKNLIKRDKVFEKLIQTFGGVIFKDGKGMTPDTAKGLKKLAVKYVSLIDIDSIEKKNLLKSAVANFDDVEIRKLSLAFTGLDAKNAATFALEILKRIDYLFNKMPYVNEVDNNNDPLGLF